MSILSSRALESATTKRPVGLVDFVDDFDREVLTSVLRLVSKVSYVGTMSQVGRVLCVPSDFSRSVSVEHVAITKQVAQLNRFRVKRRDHIPVCRGEKLSVLYQAESTRDRGPSSLLFEGSRVFSFVLQLVNVHREVKVA